jgi:mono/diheme cytochrome c family protein
LVLPTSSCLAADGKALFNDTCVLCHQPGGVGSPGLAPPIADKSLFSRLGDRAARYIAGVMLAGMSGPLEIDGVQYTGLNMPSQARMSDEELAAIGNYVLSELNGLGTQLTPANVAEIRAAPLNHAALRQLRRGEEPK